MRQICGFALGLALVTIGPPARADQPIIYPAKNQTAEQQEKDEGQCAEWAKKTTGIDPLAVAEAQVGAPSPQTGPRGERLRGAARGALAGAAVGAVAGDAGKGAGVGAAAGTVAGGVRTRRAARAEEAARDQTQQKGQQDLATYGRAYRACLEGRGYTIR